MSHGRCAVGGAHEEGCEERLKLVGAHFRGTATEATVGGQEDRVNVGENHHEQQRNPPWHAISIMLINRISVKKHTWARALFRVIVSFASKKRKVTLSCW